MKNANGAFYCACTALALALSCGGGTFTAADDAGDDAGAILPVDARPDVAADAAAVPECVDTTPFQSEQCGIALQERCRALDNERDCSAAAGVALLDNGFEFFCGWAKVVKFSALATCSVESTFGRCEAYIFQTVGCTDPCGPSAGGIYGSLQASVERGELVQNPCTAGGILDGPIGRDTAIANQQTDARDWHPCGPEVFPPPPAELCACTAVACAQ